MDGTKYRAVQQLMAEGEFRKAMDHLARVLQKNPNDLEAQRLEYTCREMVHIQSACADAPEEKKEISVEEYFSVHFRRSIRKICVFFFKLLCLLPEPLQKKLNADRFRIWELRFTLETDDQKDWLWELLFWDARRRMYVFISLVTFLVCSIVVFCLLAFGGCSSSEEMEEKTYHVLLKAALKNDIEAQFRIGESFFQGKTVPRDVEKAKEWLTKAARGGHTEAAALLQKILAQQQSAAPQNDDLWNN